MTYNHVKRRKGAHLLAILSVAVTVYYLIWRLGTFNPEAMAFSVILYCAEVYGFITTLMYLFTVWKPTKKETVSPAQGLNVDVFIPTLNEEPELLRKTVRGCLKMTYPHRTYILDDGRRPEIKALAMEMGCEYLERPDNSGAKAGNLNHAAGVTQGDFIAIFDADHVPQPDFLDKLLGYFRDEKVAFVQTPQDFYNVDSFQHRLTRNKKFWSEQSLFFSVIQPGKDRWNAAFFCGSCAIIRRRALQDTGGFATETITEDFHTSIKLHAAGWKSVFHNESLAYGLAPPVLNPFQLQRLRWGQGTTQVLRRENPLFIKGLTIPQRVCYFASSIHYFDGFQKAVFYLTPIVTLFTGYYPISALNGVFLLHFIPYFALSWWAYEEMAGGFGRIFLTEQYKMIMFYTYIKSLAGIFKNKRIRFRVTPKTEFDKTTLGMVLPQLFIVSAGLLSVFFAVYRLTVNKWSDWEMITGSTFWVLFNTGIATATIRFAQGKVQRRHAFRFPANLPALAMDATGAAPDKWMVVVRDLHEEGASITSFDKLDISSSVLLKIALAEKVVKVKGKILNIKGGDGSEAPVFHYGVVFEEITREAKDIIHDFNFNHAVPTMMLDHSIANETPVTRLLDHLRKRLLPTRHARFDCFIPGICSGSGVSGNPGMPFVTDDLSSSGIRFFSFKKIEHEKVSLRLFSPGGEIALDGSLVWCREIDCHGRKGWRYGVKFHVNDEKVKYLDTIISQINAGMPACPDM